MCVLAFAWKPNRRWRLVAAANRDEYHQRSSLPLARWDTSRELLAGKDLVSGGTWMGVSEGGRFAAVTNIRGQPGGPGRASRGQLVLRSLLNPDRTLDQDFAERFNAFNLIVAEPGGATFTTNRPGFAAHPLDAGIYGLSNGELDEPWPKTVRIKAGLAEWLDTSGEPIELLDLLAEGASEVSGHSPGESHLSPVFIADPDYGTRCSTVVAIDENGHGTIMERRYSAQAQAIGETVFHFRWPVAE